MIEFVSVSFALKVTSVVILLGILLAIFLASLVVILLGMLLLVVVIFPITFRENLGRGVVVVVVMWTAFLWSW